jgi:hypothetical protein
MNAQPRFGRTTHQGTALTTMLVASLAVLGSALFGMAVGLVTWQLSSRGFPVWLGFAAPLAGLTVLLLGFLKYDLLVFLAFSLIGFVRFEPAPFDVLLLALLAIGLLTGRLRWQSSKRETVVVIGLWALIVVNILSAAGVVPISHSLRFLAITLYMLALFVFVRMYAVEPYAMRILLIAYTVSATINAGLVVLGFLGVGVPIPVVAFGVRGVGFFKDPNVYGPFGLVAALWVADQTVRREWSFTRTIPLLFLLTVLSAGAALSLSRAALLNMAVASCIYFLLLLRGPNRAHITRLLTLGIVALVVGAFVFQFLGLGDVVASRSGYHAYDEERFDTQWHGLLAGLSNPFGVGPGGWPQAHSLYAKTMAEHGILGVTALALLIGALIVPLAQCALREPVANTLLPEALLLALIMGQLVNSVVIDSIHWRHFWILLGLAWAWLATQKGREA